MKNKKPDKKANDLTNALIGKHQNEVNANLKKQAEESEIARKNLYESHIDKDFNYSRTLKDFKEKAEIEKRASNETQYLKFLRSCKETYGNSSFYHTQYTRSLLGDEHKTIMVFCSQEIDAILKYSSSDKLNDKLSIAAELIGLTGQENHPNTIQPVFHYIKPILLKRGLTPEEAKEIVRESKDSFSPAWNQNVIPQIIDFLKETTDSILKNVVANKQFETALEVIHFLQRYELMEIPTTPYSKSIQEALFDQQFNAYLLGELKVERDESGRIKNWASYLNQQTALDFVKYQKETAEQSYKEHEAKKASLHEYVNGKKDTPIQSDASIEAVPNNVLRSTIEDWIDPFKANMTDANYNALVNALEQYFTTGSFPPIPHEIKVGKVNKKKFGWALSQLYRNEKSNTLSVEYLLFAKQHISLFKDVELDTNNLLKSNLYKYFTTKT
ncbi:MAG: hypothetical protein H7282_16785 [Cytophagaceae bacterium]|nr:hypothetical protein [Cytophagaceae bacterium]